MLGTELEADPRAQRGQATKGVKDRAVFTPGIGELLFWAA